MKVGEVWYYNGGGRFPIYDRPTNYDWDAETENLGIGHLLQNECFTILSNEEFESPLEFQLCIFFNNKKWYLEVAKSSAKRGQFKKL